MTDVRPRVDSLSIEQSEEDDGGLSDISDESDEDIQSPSKPRFLYVPKVERTPPEKLSEQASSLREQARERLRNRLGGSEDVADSDEESYSEEEEEEEEEEDEEDEESESDETSSCLPRLVRGKPLPPANFSLSLFRKDPSSEDGVETSWIGQLYFEDVVARYRESEVLSEAWTLFSLAKFDEATEQLENEESEIGRCLRVRSLCCAGRWSEALEIIRGVLKENPVNSECLILRAFVFGKFGMIESAIGNIDTVLETNPEDVMALIAKGGLCRKAIRYQEALALYGKALELKEGHVGALQGRAWTYHEMGKLEEAVSDYDQVLQAEGGDNNLLAMYNRGVALGSLGKHDMAVADFSQAMRLTRNPNYALLEARAISFHYCRAFGFARADYDKALCLCPEDARARSGRAILNLREGLLKEAAEDLMYAHRVDRSLSDFARYLQDFGETLGKAGDAVFDLEESSVKSVAVSMVKEFRRRNRLGTKFGLLKRRLSRLREKTKRIEQKNKVLRSELGKARSLRRSAEKTRESARSQLEALQIDHQIQTAELEASGAVNKVLRHRVNHLLKYILSKSPDSGEWQDAEDMVAAFFVQEWLPEEEEEGEEEEEEEEEYEGESDESEEGDEQE